MIDGARADADKIRNQATVQLGEERAAAAQELFSRTVDLAVSLAQRLLRELPLSSIEHAFLTRILEYLDRLSAEERAALVSHLSANSLIVTTAHPLDNAKETQWREQLEKRIGATAEIEFTSDPALIAGAEITFPNAILRFNWRDALTTASRSINSNEHTG